MATADSGSEWVGTRETTLQYSLLTLWHRPRASITGDMMKCEKYRQAFLDKYKMGGKGKSGPREIKNQHGL